jgi:DNA-binding NarL/FixJ family response regulator
VEKITAAIILGIIILVLVACLLVRREGPINSSQELKGAIAEARMVRDDLNQMLEKSLDISREIVNSIDNRMTGADLKETSAELNLSGAGDRGREPGKMRIYEFARALGINSKELLSRLQAMGYTYNSPLNTVDESAAAEIQERLKSETETQPDMRLKQTAMEPIEPEITDGTESWNSRPASANVQETEDWLESLQEAHPYLAVKTLADQGYSVKEIAKLLNRGQGEVSLILNLLNQKRASM